MKNKSAGLSLTRDELLQFANICTSISNDVSDTHGFISVRSLLKRFHARLIPRPLLVEGMLASLESDNKSDCKWAVLVDSEKYAVTDSDIEQETWGDPLPSRLRYTIAHELVHSLAFCALEYGVRLRKDYQDEDGMKKLVECIERDTDKLSPLLLWSEDAISNFTKEKNEALSVQQLALIRKQIGVSRYALISRLRLLKLNDKREIGERPALRNFAVGLGKWSDNGNAIFLQWPLFHNFDRSVIPTFLMTIIRQNYVPATALFKNENFVVCGGVQSTMIIESQAGTLNSMLTEKMTVECSIENTSKKPGSSFLFVIRKVI